MGRFITFSDRLLLERMYRDKLPVSLIAGILKKSRKAIYAELKKGIVYGLLNTDYTSYNSYSAEKAQCITDYRKTAHGGNLKIGSNHNAALEISRLIRQGYSPYAVSVILKRKNIISLSKNTIYSYIYSGILDISNKDLVYGKRCKKSNSKITRKHKHLFGLPIDFRPESVLLRNDFGHWEMDTVQPKKGCAECFLVLTERKTRYEIIAKLPNKETSSMLKALRRIISVYRPFFKTITCDNGSEFASASDIMADGVRVYFCHPYSSFERGSNENQNRFVRRRFPKGTSFHCVTENDVQSMQDFINTYPRAIFGGRSSVDVLRDELESMGILDKMPLLYLVI